MDIERDLHHLVANGVYKLVHIVRVGLFHDSLAEIIAKLIDHHVGHNWSNHVDQALGKCNPFRRLALCFFHGGGFLGAGALRDLILDHLLEHSATSLVEAVEVEPIENILLLGGQLRKKTVHV